MNTHHSASAMETVLHKSSHTAFSTNAHPTKPGVICVRASVTHMTIKLVDGFAEVQFSFRETCVDETARGRVLPIRRKRA